MPDPNHDITCVQPLGTAGEADRRGVASLVFAGDFCLAGTEAARAEHLFAPALLQLIRGADVSVVNLEGPIAGAGRPIPKVGPHERQCAAAPGLLRDAGFHAVTLANNHTMDYGSEGCLHTIDACKSAGLGVVGFGRDADEAHRPIELTLTNGVTVAVFSACEHEFGVASQRESGVAWVSDPRLTEGIRRAADAGRFVVVCAHGGVELVPLPPVQRRAQLRGLIDAGARLVVGHHAHVPQGWERYRGGCIFYSLGDLYFNRTSGVAEPGSDWGYLARVDVAQGGTFGAQIVPYERIGDRVEPLGAKRDPTAAMYDLHRNSAITAGDELPTRWRAMADDLMRERYEPFLRAIYPEGRRIPLTVRQASDALAHALVGAVVQPIKRVVKRLIRWPDRSATWRARDAEAHRWRCLLLLNLFRCESHRWTIESAMAARGGDLSAVPTHADAGTDADAVPHRLHEPAEKPAHEPTRAAA